MIDPFPHDFIVALRCALAVVITLIDVPLLRFRKLMGAVLSSIGV